MTSETICLVNRRKQLFKVQFCYCSQGIGSIETHFLLASRERLERHICTALREFANDDAEITWTFDRQRATRQSDCVFAYPSYLQVSAREIDSLEDLDIEEL